MIILYIDQIRPRQEAFQDLESKVKGLNPLMLYSECQAESDLTIIKELDRLDLSVSHAFFSNREITVMKIIKLARLNKIELFIHNYDSKLNQWELIELDSDYEFIQEFSNGFFEQKLNLLIDN